MIFLNQNQVYEVYAKHVYQSDMYGFIEIEAFVFGERSQMIVDPAEERLKNEYKVNVILESLPFQVARWIGGDPKALEWLESRRDFPVLRDRNEQPVLLSESMWSINFALQNAEGLELYDVEPI